MTGQARRALAGFSLITLLLPGCLNCLNPLPKTPVECLKTCEQIPTPCRESVYVVLVNGVDPLCCSNLSGLREYLNGLGFIKTFYAQLYHEKCLLKELREIHAEHPEAKFVVVGFEYGAKPAHKLTNAAIEGGLPVDLLVLLQPKGLGHDVNVGAVGPRQIVIQAGKQAATADASDAVTVSCLTRYGVPTNPTTLQILANELSQLALSIPVIGPAVESFPPILEDPAPSPRPIITQKQDAPDEWDFLKPVSRVRQPAGTDK